MAFHIFSLALPMTNVIPVYKSCKTFGMICLCRQKCYSTCNEAAVHCCELSHTGYYTKFTDNLAFEQHHDIGVVLSKSAHTFIIIIIICSSVCRLSWLHLTFSTKMRWLLRLGPCGLLQSMLIHHSWQFSSQIDDKDQAQSPDQVASQKCRLGCFDRSSTRRSYQNADAISFQD